MRQLALGRILGLLAGIIGTGVAVHFGIAANERNEEFYKWIDAKPMETAIDLSTPNVVTTPFEQTCQTSHSEALYLNLDGVKEIGDPNQVLRGLSGQIVISDPNGQIVEETSFPNLGYPNWSDDLLLAQISPFRTGKYLATIKVDTGAPALSGKRQTLYAKYLLCGLEQMPVVILGAIAFFSAFIGFISLCCVSPGLRRQGIWRLSTLET